MFLYLSIINIIAFITYGVDKYRAVKDEWRIPERVLIGLAAAGGAAGALFGMVIWHHKTRKPKFRVLVPLCLVAWIILICVLMHMIGGN